MRPLVVIALLAAGVLIVQRAAAEGSSVSVTPELVDNPNVRAFLRMIRVLEHSESAEADGSAYHTFFGGTWFDDLSNHPVLTGEKVGTPLPASMCVAAGYPNGKCVSTAAGAYQFTVPTWHDFGGGSDFSPSSQDAAAVRLLAYIGALGPLEQGDLDTALRRASMRWASLPYSTAQQQPKPLAVALQVFNEGLA